MKKLFHKLLTAIKKTNHRTFILLGLLTIFAVLSLVLFWPSYVRTWESIKGFGRSIWFAVFKHKDDPLPVLPNEPDGSDIIIPASVVELIYLLKSWAVMLFNRDYFLMSIYHFLSFLNDTLQFVVLLPYFVMLLLIVNSLLLYEKEAHEIEDSRALKRYKKFESKRILPFKEYLESWRLYYKYDAPWLLKFSFVFILLLSYRGIAILLDAVGFYLVLTKTFKFARIIPLLGSFMIDIIIMLLDYHKALLIIPLIIFIIWRRHKTARDRLTKMYNYNYEEQATHGVSNLISGPPGTGKTELMTANAILANKRLITGLLGKLQKFSKYFPDINWTSIELYVREQIKTRKWVNRTQVKKGLEELYKNEDEFSKVFNYDLKHKKTRHFNGLKFFNLGEAVATYGEAFFLYDARAPLHFSNYSVVHNYEVEGHFPNYDFDTINADKERTHKSMARILKYDSRRLYTKVNDGVGAPDESYIMDGHVETNTEVDKERGNRLDHANQSRDSLDANQVNDGYNDSVKTTRHEYTIDNTPFIYIYYDTQRPFSVNADLREVNEVRLEINNRTERKMTLPFFELDYLLLGAFVKFVDNFRLEYKGLRNDQTLYNYLLDKLSSMAGNRLDKLYNLYSYDIINYTHRRNVTTESAGESTNRNFYMINQLTRADNYATDAYSEQFSSERMKATRGFYDATFYSSFRATTAELSSQGSYWIERLNMVTKTIVEDDD